MLPDKPDGPDRVACDDRAISRALHELRDGDEVMVSAEFDWPADQTKKTFRVRQQFTRTKDGEPAAELITVSGVIDAKQRRLVTGPARRLRSLAAAPHLLGL
jgi:acyl-CoA thioester hydrolase